MLWLALYFPNLPIELLDQSEKSACPIVILDNNRVCHRNQAAQIAGIEFGTTLATAHSICPVLFHQHKEPEAEIKRLHELANVLYRFSSYVSVQAPDCVLIEISGSLKLFGTHTELLEQACALCRSLGHQTYARVARTPWAAIALVRSGAKRLHDVSLADAGIELAGVKPQVIERFDNMGIYTLGPLLDLPSKQLGRRFGKALLTYLSQLTGELPDPRHKVVPVSRFQKTIHMMQPIADKEDLFHSPLSPMQQLARELQQWLITHQQGCERLQWQFIGNVKEQETATVVVRFAQAKQSAEDILRISLLKLEQANLPAEVLSISVRSLRLQSWRNHSQNLFNFHTAKQIDEHLKLDSSAFELVSELNARLGDWVCRGVESLNQHSPEAAWCHTALSALNRKTNDQCSSVPQRPLWLFDPPRQVSVSELTLLQGPERIQSGWWQTETTARDYYIAQHKQGAECWAFREIGSSVPESKAPEQKRDPEQKRGPEQKRESPSSPSFSDTGSWYLHGYFS